MEIAIWLDRVDPPAGTLSRRDTTRGCDADPVDVGEVRFTGWLGLLRALDELMRRGDAAARGE